MGHYLNVAKSCILEDLLSIQLCNAVSTTFDHILCVDNQFEATCDIFKFSLFSKQIGIY